MTAPIHTHFVKDGVVIAKIGETKTQIRCQYGPDAGWQAGKKVNLNKEPGFEYNYTTRKPERYYYTQIGSTSSNYRIHWFGYETAETAEAAAAAERAQEKDRREAQLVKDAAAQAKREAAYMALYEKNATAIANATRVPTFMGELVIFEYLNDRDIRQVMVAQMREKPLTEWEAEYRPNRAPEWQIAVNCSSRWNTDETHFGSLASSSTITEATPELAWGHAMQ